MVAGNAPPLARRRTMALAQAPNVIPAKAGIQSRCSFLGFDFRRDDGISAMLHRRIPRGRTLTCAYMDGSRRCQSTEVKNSRQCPEQVKDFRFPRAIILETPKDIRGGCDQFSPMDWDSGKVSRAAASRPHEGRSTSKKSKRRAGRNPADDCMG